MAGSDRFMDVLAQRMEWSDAMMKPVTPLMKRSMDKNMTWAIWNAYSSIKWEPTKEYVGWTDEEKPARWRNRNLSPNLAASGNCTMTTEVTIIQNLSPKVDLCRRAKDAHRLRTCEKTVQQMSPVKARITGDRWEADIQRSRQKDLGRALAAGNATRSITKFWMYSDRLTTDIGHNWVSAFIVLSHKSQIYGEQSAKHVST